MAGLGTRFLPATKAQPKEMLPIVDKPTLQLIIEKAVGFKPSASIEEGLHRFADWYVEYYGVK